jgi:hypothetical protein
VQPLLRYSFYSLEKKDGGIKKTKLINIQYRAPLTHTLISNEQGASNTAAFFYLQ